MLIVVRLYNERRKEVSRQGQNEAKGSARSTLLLIDISKNPENVAQLFAPSQVHKFGHVSTKP